jgi:hypothetical protein
MSTYRKWDCINKILFVILFSLENVKYTKLSNGFNCIGTCLQNCTQVHQVMLIVVMGFFTHCANVHELQYFAISTYFVTI